MPNNEYCYANSNVLINKLNIHDEKELSSVEARLTLARLIQLQEHPIRGYFDFNHLKKIHKFIFQDLYDWAGEKRTVEIGKGNYFCLTKFIDSYARSVFNKYYSQCSDSKDNHKDFVKALSNNYGDLNALHPFREGNGRAQREFARCVCLECGYDFDLSFTVHEEMLHASIISFNEGDNSELEKIFSEAVTPLKYSKNITEHGNLKILSSDDLSLIDDISDVNHYDYCESYEVNNLDKYNQIYKERIHKMDSEKNNESHSQGFHR